MRFSEKVRELKKELKEIKKSLNQLQSGTLPHSDVKELITKERKLRTEYKKVSAEKFHFIELDLQELDTKV